MRSIIAVFDRELGKVRWTRLSHICGRAASTYREELRRRGLSDSSIESGIDRGWFTNWQSGIPAEFTSDTENIAGIDPSTGLTCSWDGLFLPAIKDGQIVGGQLYPRPQIERKLGRSENVPKGLGKYTWLSSSRKGGVNAHCFDTGENPLFLREHPGSKSEEIENLNLCEGALKSAIAFLKFEERGKLDPWLGAAGGVFSRKELSQRLNKYPNLKTATLYPDAGSLDNLDITRKYRRTIDSIEKLTAGRVKVLIAWWGQHNKNEDRDVDEMTEQDLENLTIKSYGNSIMAEAGAIADETEDSPEATNQVPHFKSSIEDGLIWVSFEKDKKGWLIESEEWIGNHLNAIAYVNNLDRDGAALHLEFKTIEGNIRYWTMLRADLAGDGSAIVAGLLSRSYDFKRKQKSSLLDYIHSLGSEVEQTYVVTDSSGWVQKSFVLPHKTHGDRNLKFRDVEPSPDVMTEIVGSLDGWINTVAIGCAGNSRLILALGASFAAPLLHILGIESGGFHLVGPTSKGKTTILTVAASVIGLKDIPHWRTTTNGLESIATAFNHLCLVLDEIGQADPRDVGNIAYMLANGQPKARMNRDLTNRKGKSWRLMVLSSGEVGLGNYMRQANITLKGGQEVRLPDIPAIPDGSNYGCFETIHGAETAAQFVAALDAAVKQHHGTALDAFLSQLVIDAADPDFAGTLSKQVHLLAAKISEGTIDSAIGRVAKRFAVVQVALGIAHKYGLLPFPIEKIDWAISTVFKDWLKARGGDGSIDVKQAIDRIEHLLVTNEFSDRIYTLPDNDDRPVRNLLAYRKVDIECNTEEFWVPPSVFSHEFCDGVNQSEIVRELQRIDWLLPPRSDGKAVLQRRVNNQRGYYYVFGNWKKASESGESGESPASKPSTGAVSATESQTPQPKSVGESGESALMQIDPLTHPTPSDSPPYQLELLSQNPLSEQILITDSPDSPDSLPKTHLPNSIAEINSILDSHNWQVGDLVIHADRYHTHGADTGIVEKVIEDRLLIWWESNGEDQIAEAFRTYGIDDLKAA